MSQPFNVADQLQLGVDRIATSPTAYILYENPLAMFRGAPGAPRLGAWGVVVPVEAGDNVRYSDELRSAISIIDTPGVFTLLKQVMILAAGTVRVTYKTIRPNTGNLTTQVIRIRRVTIDLQAEHAHSSGSGDGTILRTVTSVTVEPGDSIAIQGRFTSDDPAGSRAAVTEFNIRTSAAYIWAMGGGSLVLPNEPV